MERSNQEVRRLRHDMNNHLQTIALMARDNPELVGYIEQLAGKLGSTKLYSNTGNVAIDSVINYKLTQAAEKEIHVESRVHMPEQRYENSGDLVTILSNLLDNALEAAEYLKENRYLKLLIGYEKGMLSIEVRGDWMKDVKKTVDWLISKAALASARENVNSACMFFYYQPKVSDSAQKLKKYDT